LGWTDLLNCGARVGSRERERDMARKTSGKRGSAIILMVIVAAIAGSPSTATAASATAPSVSVSVSAPLLGYSPLLASWSEASWAEE